MVLLLQYTLIFSSVLILVAHRDEPSRHRLSDCHR